MISKAYKKCVWLIEKMIVEGFQLQVTSTYVEKLIMEHVGADERAIQKYMKLLTEIFGFLESVTQNSSGVCIYQINAEIVKQHASERVKEKLKQLALSDMHLKHEEEAKTDEVKAEDN